MQLQSAQKVTTVMATTARNFCHCFSRWLSATDRATTPQNRGQSTLVWLNTVVSKGMNGMPKAKL